MAGAVEHVKRMFVLHRSFFALAAAVLILTAIPFADVRLVLGDTWQSIMPAFGDEALYLARVETLVHGRTGGNPYFLEHSEGAPLVIFGGAWLNALPQVAGLAFDASLIFNFVLWSLLFAAAGYWFLRELRIPSWAAASGTFLLYLQSYPHVWRPVNLQTVYPFYFLFYVALMRFLREQSRRNIVFLALATGATFYMFAFLWQIALITLGLLFLYAAYMRRWPLARATFIAAGAGGLIGLPVPLYMLWLSRVSPHYWGSMGRLGLVDTHLPMAEVIYSGGWIGVVLILLAVLYWRVRTLWDDDTFALLGLCIAISGLGLWVMQGSNLITGKLLETGEHVRVLILPWLICSTLALAVVLWERRVRLSRGLRLFSAAVLVLLFGASACTAYQRFTPFLPSHADSAAWRTQQLYAGPFTWLDEHEKDPVVVWSEPRDYLATALPVFTRHFALYAFWGALELVSEDEIRERYLVSQYFNNPTATDLAEMSSMELYLGRGDVFHKPKTVERSIKLCRLLFFWDADRDCGTPPTPQELLGADFFSDLEKKFKTDIKPNIKAYLAKYHVTYLLKDKVLNPTYRPQVLGAARVYEDDRYELYRL